ncbi:MAG TPA: VWA domain-containing protein, partial [Bacteroidales bacterium]|nr:VWA domain-containing protein [Bacteroidales bacterium]
ALLSYSALKNNDKVGVIFFSDRIEKFIPPGKGVQHVLFIIRQLVDFTPEKKHTNISEALRYLSNIIRKRCIAFIISDFLDESYEDALRITSRKHDMVGLRIFDPIESEIPVRSLLRVTDPETGRPSWVDGRSARERQEYARRFEDRSARLRNVFIRSGVDLEMISTREDFVKPLIRLFKRREMRK